MASGVTDHLWQFLIYFRRRKIRNLTIDALGGIMLDLILILLLLLISFACGYGIRKLKLRRRHAAAREEYYLRHPEERS